MRGDSDGPALAEYGLSQCHHFLARKPRSRAREGAISLGQGNNDMRTFGYFARCIILLTLFWGQKTECQETNTKKDHEDVPEIVLVIRNPWALVFFSDAPKIVMYSSGICILSERVEKERGLPTAKEIVLDEVEHKKIVDAIGAKIAGLPSIIGKPTSQKDFPCVEIYASLPGHRKIAISAFNLVDLDSKFPDKLDSSQTTDTVLKDLAHVFNFLNGYSAEGGKEWHPKKMMLFATPWNRPNKKMPMWPLEFPSIKDSAKYKPGDRGFGVEISGDLESKIRNFILENKLAECFESNDAYWGITFRYLYPNEDVWEKVLKKNRDAISNVSLPAVKDTSPPAGGTSEKEKR